MSEFTISNNRETLDFDLIFRFLTTETYWARDRSFEIVKKSFQNSLPFVILSGSETCGFARVVTDYANFAWIADVFIRKEFRGSGLSKFLMREILAHRDLQDVKRWVLATKDAHGLYRQFGFEELHVPEIWMERTPPNTYSKFDDEEN